MAFPQTQKPAAAPTTPAPTTPVTPVTITPALTPEVKIETPTTAEILKRASETKPAETVTPESEKIFSSKDLKGELDKIQDPNQRKMFEDVYNNMEKGLSKKMRELGNKISEYDQKLKASDTWTPERLRNEINRQDFLAAAQSVMQTQPAPPPSNWEGSQEQWSALTPQEQNRMKSLENEMQNLRGQNEHLAIDRADQDIKQRLPNYDPAEVNNLQQRLLRRELPISQIRELLWKAQNFDKAVKQSYELAMQDRSGVMAEKLSASSSFGSVTNTQSDVPVKKDGESTSSWFKRIAEFRLKEAKEKGSR